MVLLATHAVRHEHQLLSKQVHAMRVANHGEPEHVKEFLDSLVVPDPEEQKDQQANARELLKDFRGGEFLAPKARKPGPRAKGKLVPTK